MTEKNTQKTNKTEIYNFEKIIKIDKASNINHYSSFLDLLVRINPTF